MAHWGFFFMFFANNFFLKIGNLSIETEFRCKNLTLEGNWWLANIFARQFVFLESQNVWDKTVISCKQFFKKGSHWKIFRKLLWKECFYKSPNAWNANVTKHLKLTNNRLIQLQPELPKKRKKRCFLVVFLIGTIFFFTALHVKTKYGCLSVIRLEFFISAKWRTQKRFGMRGQKKSPVGQRPTGDFFLCFLQIIFFLKVGNLSSETEFRCKNLTFGGNWRLGHLLSRPFLFLESQNVWDKTVILCKQFFKKGSHWKIFRKLLWKECFYKSPNAWNANVTKHLKLTNNRLIQLQPELPKKTQKTLFFSCFFNRNNIFFHGSPRQNEIRLSFRNTPGIFY